LNLDSDLQILRNLRIPHKADMIQIIGHLYTHHGSAFEGLDGADLKNIVFSRTTTTKEIASALQDAESPEARGEAVDAMRVRDQKARQTDKEGQSRRHRAHNRGHQQRARSASG